MIRNVTQNVSQKCDAKKSLAFLATEPVFLANETDFDGMTQKKQSFFCVTELKDC